ncbi:heavy metal-associated isoprenylated plant protein 41-like [Tasmannia lanceolata]|uniref:heavy metal-associated isoprenylated plant protein 41-like n=1 Tax=Tasmannia lanceolata TaxID=3420 RepID=UPI00406426CD
MGQALSYFNTTKKSEGKEETELRIVHCSQLVDSRTVLYLRWLQEVEKQKREEEKREQQTLYNNLPAYITNSRVEKEEKWIKYYSSSHRILLVGEGDFSFSACLALAFGSANNMVSTSLDSLEFLRKNYSRALSNIDLLKRSGCKVIHGVDATVMVDHYYLKGMKFDRIVFNFPHGGFYRDESRITQIKDLLGTIPEGISQMVIALGNTGAEPFVGDTDSDRSVARVVFAA